MNRCLLILTPLLFFAFGQDRSQINLAQPEDVLAVLENAFAHFDTYQAQFREHSSASVKRGEIRFKKPHFLQVVYYTKEKTPYLEMHANGKTLWIYLKKFNIVCEQELKYSEQGEEAAVAKVIQLSRLIKNYDFNFLEAKVPVPVLKREDFEKFEIFIRKNFKAYHFKLSPKDKSLGLNPMELWISSDGNIRRCRARTLDQREIDFFFETIETNIPLADRIFDFDIPSDVQILKNTLIDFSELEDQDAAEG